jgi:arylsulfate sulfotransferase
MALSFWGCNTTNETDFDEAEILSFGIAEYPSVSFTVDNSTGLISIAAGEIEEEDFELLTPVFTSSKNSSVFVGDSLQVSGESTQGFSDGVTYTVVSEDGMLIKEYFVFLTEQLPKSYLLEGEIGIHVNPSGIAPLSAMASIKTKKDVSINFTVLGTTELTNDLPDFSKSQQVAVHGLYANSSNRIAFTLTDRNNVSVFDTVTAQTGALPDFFPEITIDVLDQTQMEPGMHFSSFSVGNSGEFESYPMIFDHEGEVRWYLDMKEQPGITWGVTFLEDGTLFASVRSGIIEFDLFGNIIRHIETPGNVLHHDVLKLPNGNYVAIADHDGTKIIKNGQEITSVEDYIIEVDGVTGEVVNEWDMGEILDVSRIDVVDGGGDWFHMNAIWYDESDEALIVSGRNQGIVKVDWNNELQWILAPHQGWELAGRTGEGFDTTPFLLEAINEFDSPYSESIQQGTEEHFFFSWAWGQHAPMILENGNLLVFDNGTNRNFGAASQYSQASEYEIDEENMTAKMVWNYGKGRGSETYSNIISDIDVLPVTQNRLFSPGFITGSPNSAKMVEVTYPDNVVVFESTLSFKNLLGNGQGWGQIDLAYRGERVSLY